MKQEANIAEPSLIEVKKLPADRWRDCRDLRLEALKNDPMAFGSSYEEEESLSENEWRIRIKNALFALLNDKPVGMIVYIRNNKDFKNIQVLLRQL